MKKKLLIILILCISCQTNKELMVTPMSEGVNYYAEYKAQYFEIDNYSKYPDSILMDKILSFSENELSKNNQMPPKVLTQQFYKKTLFGGCKNFDKILEAESDGEAQNIRGCKDQHKVAIRIYPWERKINDSTYIKNDSLFNRDITIWSDNYLEDLTYPSGKRKTYISRRDSILVKGTTWKILKKGMIERN